MSYLRTFYNQNGDFEANLSFVGDTAYTRSSFGLSGTGGAVLFDVSGGFVRVNGTLCASLNEDRSAFFSVCGNGGNVTVWQNERPLIHLFPSGFTFNSIFCNSPTGSLFAESLAGRQPSIGHSFSGWNNTLKSGNIFIKNNGAYSLGISGLSLADIPLDLYFTPTSIAPNASGYFPIAYRSNSPFSGTGIFNVTTNAGSYQFTEYFDCQPINTYGSISVSFANDFIRPTGQSQFSIRNEGIQDAMVNLFLDYSSGTLKDISTGYARYPTGVGTGTGYFNYASGGFFRPIPGSGRFSYFSAVTGGATGLTYGYTGNFTGIGGRLGATGVQVKSGSYFVSLTGVVSGNNYFNIPMDVDVYEGQGSIFDLWNIIYYDTERGAENFTTLSRKNSSGFGVTGVTYRVPVGGTTSGVVYFANNYAKDIFQNLIFRVTDNSSINTNLYINS